MTVAAQTPVNRYTYAGSSTFVFNFLVLAVGDLVVDVDGVVATYGTDYTVSGVGVATGGSVTYIGSLTIGQIVTLRRITARTRSTDYQYAGDLPSDTLDQDFDRIWMTLQEQDAIESTAVRVPAGETVGTLPSALVRAGRLLGFDSGGAVVAVVPTSGDASSLALDLASTNAAAKGAGQIGYSAARSYSSGTVGYMLKNMPWANLTGKPTTWADWTGSLTGVPTTLTGAGYSSSDPLLSPVGSIIDFGGETPPSGWLECDGSSLLRASYPALFAAIGTLHGTADSSHFNLPDHRGKFKRGWAHGTANDPDAATRTAAATGGATGDHVGTAQGWQNAAHTHQFAGSSGVGGTNQISSTTGQAPGFVTTTSSGGNQANPINAAVMSIIKHQ